MAAGKKSFIAYSDWKEVFDELPDEDAGKLIKHIFSYVNDENPITDSVLIRAVFANIKSTLKRDLEKWDNTKTKRSDAGKIGGLNSGESRKSKQKEANASKSKQKEAVNVNDNVSVNVNDILFIKRPGPESMSMGLTEVQIGSAIEYIFFTKNIKVQKNRINGLWSVFKVKNFTGENFYESPAKIFSHFMNTLKTEKINGTEINTAATKRTGRTAGLYAAAERLKAKFDNGRGETDNLPEV